MITLENEYFLRLFILIVKGGTLVLRHFCVKKLEDQRSQLDDFIKENTEKIKKLKEEKVLTSIQYKMLLPNDGTTIDICKWDISLLSCLLLNMFDLTDQSEKKAITNIRNLRNDIVAHNPDIRIKTNTFFNKWNHLSTAIMNLANGLSATERSELIEIKRSAGDDPLDIKNTIQMIKDKDDMSHDSEQISQTLEQLFLNFQELRASQKDMQADVSNIKAQLEECLSKDNQDIPTDIIGGITIKGNPEAVAKSVLELIAASKKLKENCSEQGAINTLLSFFARVKNVCCKSDISTEGEDILTPLFQDIRNSGCEVIDVTEGSVLLHIQCNSVTGVLNMLEYFQSVKIEHRLDKISAHLHQQIGFPVSLEACIQVESLRGALHRIQEKQNQEFIKSVHFVMKCRDAESVSNITKIFDGQDASDNMSTLSERLSNKVGSHVTLKAFIKTDISPAVSGIESRKEQEKNDSQSNDLTDEKPWKTLGEKTEQCYDDAFSLLRLGEQQYECVAFLFYSDKDKYDGDFVKDKLGRALQDLTGIDRDLICTADEYNPPGSYIPYTFMQYLKMSSSVVVIESQCLDETHIAKLKDAQKLEKKIILISFEKDELYLKGFTSDLRLVLNKENEKYTLDTTWREVAISIMNLISREIGANAKEISSPRVSGIMKIADAIPVSSISEETPLLEDNTELDIGDRPAQLNADIFKEMLPSLRKRRSKEENEEEDVFFEPMTEQEIKEEKNVTKVSEGEIGESVIMRTTDAIPVSSISEETPLLDENAELETEECFVSLNEDISKEIFPLLGKRRSKEENEEKVNLFLDPMTEQEIKEEKKITKASDLANKSWDDCDKRVRFNTGASRQGYKQAPRLEYGLASRAYSCPVFGFYGGPCKLDNVYNYSRLKVSNFDLPKDVDRDELQKHLAKEEFEDIFEMTIEEFRELPELKRNDLKRKADLY